MNRMLSGWLAGVLLAGVFAFLPAWAEGKVQAQESGPIGHTASAGGEGTFNCSISHGTAYSTVFMPYTLYDCGWETHGIGAGDFNHDGRTDVALSTAELLIFLQNSDGTLAQPVSHSSGNGTFFLETGDFNNDGRDDVATADPVDGVIRVYLQQEGGGLADGVTYATNSHPDSIAVGDVNNDALDDILVTLGNSETIGVFTQNLDHMLNPLVAYASAYQSGNDIAAGDVNGDGRTDVVKMWGPPGFHLMVYLQNEGGTLDAGVSYAISNCPFAGCFAKSLAAGDVTGDGLEDVILSYDGIDAKIAIFQQEAGGALHSSIAYPSYALPRTVEVGDINSDSRPDVVVLHNGGWPQAGVYTQLENGTLGKEVLYPLADDSYFMNQDLDIADVNGDGYADLLVADRKGMVILYHRLPTPEPISPSAKISDATPTFIWGSISGATQYQYELMKGTTPVYSVLAAPDVCASATCSSTPAVVLQDASYNWRIQVLVGDEWMPYSNYKLFVVDAVPTLTFPRSRISDTTPRFEWRGIKGATHYRFQVLKGTTLVYTRLAYASACRTSTNLCSSTPAVILKDGNYKWRAQAMSGGEWMPYSSYLAFSLRTVPTPLAPSGMISDIMPRYKWTRIVGASQYRFQVFNGTGLVFTQTFLDSSCEFTTCQFEPYNPLSVGSYSWKVQAMLGGVWKPYSPSKAFSISPYTKPKAGFWKGLKEQFYVTADQKYVDDFSSYVAVPGCGSYKITHTALVPISNNYFGFSGPFHAGGTFNSPTTVAGSAGLISYYIPGCGYVSGGPWSYTAAWNSASQPLIATVDPESGIDIAAWIGQVFAGYHTVTLDASSP